MKSEQKEELTCLWEPENSRRHGKHNVEWTVNASHWGDKQTMHSGENHSQQPVPEMLPLQEVHIQVTMILPVLLLLLAKTSGLAWSHFQCKR